MTKEANLQSRLQSTPEVERAYDTLNRDAVTARQMYDQLNSKRMDADIRAAAIKIGAADQFTLVAPPLVPKAPTKPPRIGIAVIGLIAATFLALMAGARRQRAGLHRARQSRSRGASGADADRRRAGDPQCRIRARRRRRLTALAATTLVAVPALYLLIRFAVP